MNPLWIIGGVAAIWFLLRQQQSSFATMLKGGSTQPSNTAIMIGSTIPAGTGGSTTDVQVTKGFQVALQHDPDPTGISQSLLSIGSQVSAVFTAAHQAALKKEATTLNNAIPNFIKEVQSAMGALGQGAITESQAIAYLQQAQADYYTTVSGISDKSGTCTVATSTTMKPSGTPNLTGLGTGKVDAHGCPISSGSCNAACCVACYTVEPAVRNLTAIIKSGGGSYTIEAHGGNGLIAGNPAVTISYRRPSAVSQAASGFDNMLLGIGL